MVWWIADSLSILLIVLLSINSLHFDAGNFGLGFKLHLGINNWLQIGIEWFFIK